MEQKSGTKKKLFISGPITGIEDYRERFGEAREFYESKGYAVMSPTDLPEGMSNADYMRCCLAMIDTANEVVLLPGWHESIGARLEHDYCYYIRKKKRLYADDLDTEPCKTVAEAETANGEQDEKSKDNKVKGAIDITALIERILAGEKDDSDAFENLMDFAIGQALDSGYTIDFSKDSDGWKNITLRAPGVYKPVELYREEADPERGSLWVSVDDKLPKHGEDVLVHYSDSVCGNKMGVGWYGRMGSLSEQWNVFGSAGSPRVTAWTKLPPMPPTIKSE